ncbi:MAG: hypothetical protein PHQ12_14595 [Chthoniobacteraceae bacterium]|nr:hypothetical protein [Chthoniobacteraceae bacterium]
MRFLLKLGALLAALFLVVLPACALVDFSNVHFGALVFAFGGMLGLVGVTVIYGWPVQGVTAPTAAQASRCSVQTATVVMGDTETQAAFTHNWGASNSTGGWIAASFPTFLFPIICARLQEGSSTSVTFMTALTYDISNTNVVFINKANGAFGGTFVVTLLRPHSLIR